MRQHRRISFRSIFRIKVCNRLNDQLIGYVADLSAGGLRLLSDTAMEPDSCTVMRLKMRVREDEILQLDISLRCMWSRENQKTGRFESGFLLLEPSAEFTRLVDDLLAARAKA
jgi:c-di-GMP-binding flagellar brake protein YcgR